MPHSSNAQKRHIKTKNKLEQSQRLSWEAVVDGWCLSGCIQSRLPTAGGLGSHLSAEGPWHVGPQQFYMKADTSQQVYVCVFSLCQPRFEKMCQKQLMLATQESSQNSQGQQLPWGQLLPPPHAFTMTYSTRAMPTYTQLFFSTISADKQRGKRAITDWDAVWLEMKVWN